MSVAVRCDQRRREAHCGLTLVKRLVAVAAVTVAAPAFAEISWSVDAGVARTDNAALREADGVSDTLPSIGGTIAYEQDTRRIQAALNGFGNYVDYVDDTFDDDFRAYAAGSLVLGIVPDSFLWSIEDTYGQVAINEFEPVTPRNRQNLNSLSTGPDFILRLGAQSDLTLSARFGDARYENSEQIDSQTLQGSLAFRRKLSVTSSWGVVASASHVEYDRPGTEDYDQPALYGTWQSASARQTVVIDVGVNRVEGAEDSYTKPLLRVDWNRRIAPSWSIDLTLGSEYQNSAEQFVRRSARLEPGSADLGISDAPAAAYFGGLSFVFERVRTRLRLGGGYSELEYVVDNGLNKQSWYTTAEFSRRLTPRLRGSLSYTLEQRDYESEPTRDETNQMATFRLDWRVGGATFLAAGYQYSDSDTDSETASYEANLYFLRLSYRYGESEQQQQAPLY